MLCGVTAAVLSVLVYSAAGAMDWPIDESAVLKNFGYNEQGRPLLGFAFLGDGVIKASSDGVILYSRRENHSASRLPSPMGAWMALDHGDGIISIYGRYNDAEQELPFFEEKGSSLALAGISGWSSFNGLYFQLYDRMERRWINPAMVIPFTDTVSPQILGVQMRNSGGRIFEGSQIRNLVQGKYTILINAVDLMEIKGRQLAPHRIVCSVNGEEAGLLLFETISARDGTLMINRNGLKKAVTIYAPYPFLEAGEVQLSRGQAILEISVHDISGNSDNIVYRIQVE